MKNINQELGNSAKEFRDNHGTLTFKAIKKAMDKLSAGNLADFLMEIHGDRHSFLNGPVKWHLDAN